MEDWMLNQLLKDKDSFSWPYEGSPKTTLVENKECTIGTYGGWKKNETCASSKQVGGDHYKKFSIQPAEFCYANNIPYLEATTIKYLCRWKDKGGIQDLDKAIHFIELLKEFEIAKLR